MTGFQVFFPPAKSGVGRLFIHPRAFFTRSLSHRKRAAAEACNCPPVDLGNFAARGNSLGADVGEGAEAAAVPRLGKVPARRGVPRILEALPRARARRVVPAVRHKATTVVAHLALRAPGNPAEESVARRLAWISMD